MWTAQYSRETAASPSAVYALLSSPETWPDWNEGVARVDLDGPFAAGAGGVMTFPDGTTLSFTIRWVEPGRGFEDATPVPDAGVVVRVRHEVTATGAGALITYTVEADGNDEQAAEIGAGASADFPAVIAALAARAESRS